MPVKSTPAALGLALAGALLAGCSVKTHDADGNQSASISFGDGNGGDGGNGSDGDKSVSVNVPGFSAKVAVPGLALGGDNSRIDGIALYPGTTMSGVNVNATDNDGSGGESQGRVDMAFTAPATPDRLLAYYRRAAKNGGWSEQPPAAGQQFAATKTDEKGKVDHLALSLVGAGSGSTGHFQIDGS